MKFLVLAFVALLAIASTANAICTQDLQDRANTAFRKLLVFGSRDGKGWPRDMTGFDSFCNEAREHRRLVREYANECLNGFAKKVINQLVRGVEKVENHFCIENRRQDYLLPIGKCANTATDPAHTCLEVFNRDVAKAIQVEDDKKMHTVCCAFYRTKQCIIAHLDKDVCTRDQKADLEKQILTLTKDIRDLSCSTVQEDSNICRTYMQEIDKLPEPDRKYNTPLIPFVELLKRL